MPTKIFIVVIMLLATSLAAAGEGDSSLPDISDDLSEASVREAFPYLTFLEVDDSFIRAVVGYNGKNTTIINKKLSALPKSHPLYVKEDFEADDILVMETALGSDGVRYYILFSDGPSTDPEFYLVSPRAPGKVWARLYGTALALPGNGAAYIAGRHNELFTRRSKYRYTPGGMSKVEQPFAYIGLKTRTLTAITIYSTPDEKTPVAQLPQGTEIEVLLANEQIEQRQEICLLLKTPLGLVGWAWVPYGQYQATAIQGISYWGD